MMRKLTLTLAALACVGLAMPVFTTASMAAGSKNPQLAGADPTGKVSSVHELSAAGKKKGKKKGLTTRKSWGG
jgi:hypothetical protein